MSTKNVEKFEEKSLKSRESGENRWNSSPPKNQIHGSIFSDVVPLARENLHGGLVDVTLEDRFLPEPPENGQERPLAQDGLMDVAIESKKK